MRNIRFVLFFILLTVGLGTQAQEARQFVVAPDVVVQYAGGTIRFCERENVRGIACVYEQRIFGKKLHPARNWWSPETYVQAKTGLNEFTLWSVEPTGDGRGLVIYFSP